MQDISAFRILRRCSTDTTGNLGTMIPLDAARDYVFWGANPVMGGVVRRMRCCGSIAGSLRYGLCGRDPGS